MDGDEDREHRTSQRQENTSTEEPSVRESKGGSSVEFSHYPNGIILISFRMVGRVYYHTEERTVHRGTQLYTVWWVLQYKQH